ncbi:oligosaccharide flippase family protein [Pseudomonas sp. 43NM1]|uniref:oligosaccharide flippase family protein n=1 Tax=Pseudomonas sp. 43NM1 TaxID=1904755 RepID=UPI0015ABEA61|nr:oligosaccharide flippase family protein [Pseudomonas sp. 43NM1]
MIRPIINIGCQAFFKLIFAIASLKIVAFYVGPSGMAVVGQIQSFLQILSAGASSVTTTGVVKLIAEDKHPKDKILQSSLLLLGVLSLAFLVVLLFASNFISNLFLQGEWVGVLLLLPLGAFFLGLNNLFISYFNGEQKYSEYFWYSVITAFAVALFTCGFSLLFAKTGAVYSIVLAPALAGLLVLLLPAKFRLPKLPFASLNIEIIEILLSYSLMALGSVVIVYGVQIILRDYIATNGALAEAGMWYASTRLSDIYMGICSVLFSTILLPKYSSVEGKALTSVVVKFGLITLCFVIVMVVSVRLLASFAVGLIYGDAFAAAAEIMKIYVLGDSLKCLSWIFLYVMIAKQHVRFYLVYEMVSAFLYLLFCILCYQFYGFAKMAYGYPLQGAVSLLMVLTWFWLSRYKSLSSEQNEKHDAV